MPTGATNIEGTLHVDRYLTNFSVQYVQDESNFVSQTAASQISVQKQTDLYVVYDRGYFWRDEAAPRPLGGRPLQVGYKVSSGTYNAIEYGLEHVIDDRQRANADDNFRLDENATRLLTQKHMIKRDRLWAQKFWGAGIWSTEAGGIGSGTPGAGQFLQFNESTSDPISVIDEYKDIIHKRTGFMPNTLVIGAGVRRVLRLHPDITDRIKYTQTGVSDEEMLAKLFEVERVVVARSIYNAAKEGQADDFEYIIDEKAMLLAYIDRNPGLDSPTAIATFNWTGLIPGTANALGGVIERGRDDRAHSDWFQARAAWDTVLVAPDLAAYFNAVVS